uniref:Death domain-containing protein n=1 Tax=Amphimedon queenslandica TaxID=400682 RepID=A0A1X7U8A8_AMPQE
MANKQLNSNVRLDITDLKSILNKLNNLSKKRWFDFGLEAGLYQPTLLAIEADYPKDVKRCFQQCVSYWLKGSDGVHEEGKPTWLRLMDILTALGENELVDTIRNQVFPPSSSADMHTSAHFVPSKLKNEYSDMNDKFSIILNDFAQEVIKGNLLDDFKGFLLARSNLSGERKSEITNVCNPLDLLPLLRKYFFLYNFRPIRSFVKKHNLVCNHTLLVFSDEIDEFYRQILAQDFAKQAIEDYKRGYCGEIILKVVWNLDITLKEFQDFLAEAFHSHGMLILLRVVSQN